MRRSKTEWLLIIVGGLLGACIGFAAAYYGTQNHDNPFDAEWSEDIGRDAELHVTIFKRPVYSLITPEKGVVPTAAKFFRWIPGILLIGFCFAVGVQLGAIVGRRACLLRNGMKIGQNEMPMRKPM